MSKTASRPADQPNQRRTARNVSRASSSPDSTSMSTPVRSRTWSSTASELTASRTAEVANAEHLLAALVLGDDQRLGGEVVSASMPRSRTAPSSSRCSASRSGCLWENAGSGAAPPCASTTSRWPVLEPMSRTPRRMRQTYRAAVADRRVGLTACPRSTWSSRARSWSSSNPADESRGDALRPHLADLELHVHLRPGLPGHLQGRPRRRLLHARRALRRQGRREAGGGVRRPARRGPVAVPPRAGKVRKSDWIETDDEGERKTRTIEVDGQSACIFHNRPDFHAGRRLRPARAGAAAGPQPARDQARRVLAAADPAHVPRRRAPGRHDVHRGLDRRVRPARLGPRRPRPRLVLLGQHRGARRASSRSTSPTSPSWSS